METGANFNYIYLCDIWIQLISSFYLLEYIYIHVITQIKKLKDFQVSLLCHECNAVILFSQYVDVPDYISSDLIFFIISIQQIDNGTSSKFVSFLNKHT